MPGIAYNRTQIIQQALILSGGPIITSIDSGGEAAKAAHELYDSLMAATLSMPNWRFATHVIQLSRLAGIDPEFVNYQSAYQIPPNLLAIWRTYPDVPMMRFGERLWSVGRDDTIQVEYRAVVPESQLPPAFIMYFTYSLASMMAPSISEDPNIIASIEKALDKWKPVAMVVNSQENENAGIFKSPWLANRIPGGFGGYGGAR